MRIKSNRLVGVMGGTFNPVHYGHLRMAQELADALKLDEVRFVPSANPPHKSAPEVSATHRAEMVKIAISDNPLFTFDDRELLREGASYTIDTLIALREALGEKTTICLLLGSDAFMQLNTWHRWQELLNYCHIVLAQRPNSWLNQPKLVENLEALLHDHYTEKMTDLAENNAGYIHMQKITALDISSTAIRALFKQGQVPHYLMPELVISYTKQHQLFQ